MEVNISFGRSCGWARATPVKGSPEREWMTDATDPWTVASAPVVKLGEVLTRASWTGVSVSVDFEGDGSDTIKGVKDWITACEMAVAMPWKVVALGVAMNDDVDADVVVATDVELVLVAVDVGGKGAARTRLTRGTSGPELRATLLERDGRGIILGEKTKTKTNQAACKARPDQIITSGSGLKSPAKNDTAHYNTHKQHINSTVPWQTIQHSVAAECSVLCCKDILCQYRPVTSCLTGAMELSS